MIKPILSSVLTLVFFTCFSQPKQPIAEHYKTKDYDIAVFPESFNAFSSKRSFTPTKLEIKKAEQHLNSKLFSQSRSPIVHENLNKYKRQYFGYFDEKGERILYINCFWEDVLKHDWLNRRIFVLDGGSYYWEVYFNLQTEQLYNFSVHGDA